MKIAFTVGGFDCLGLQHTHLIKEIRKNVLNNGEFHIAVFDDYPFFVRNKYFPLQEQKHRINNLKFLVPEESIYQVLQEDCCSFIDHLRDKSRGAKLSLIVYRGQENIPEVDYCKKNKIHIKFIKPPKYET